MNHLEHKKILVKRLEHLLKVHRKGWLSSTGLVESLKLELAMADDKADITFLTEAQDSRPDADLPQATAVRTRRTEMLARKTNLILDTIMADSGKWSNYPAIRDGSQETGYYISRTRWSRLKNGKKQVVPDECLHTLAKVFGVDSDYLVQEDDEPSEQVRTELSRFQHLRRAGVRDFAARSLELADLKALEAITAVLRENP
ncbi:hypothetical protein [Arthrobacter sp. GMC3]|uniref:hypothetical protein n=1 Tax=Arthrobacter sp. GMC3 TaxID=2058894 RepID=UPI000CE31530|nr:hypothetical protein [Arthrobacter sp. GMC3]